MQKLGEGQKPGSTRAALIAGASWSRPFALRRISNPASQGSSRRPLGRPRRNKRRGTPLVGGLGSRAYDQPGGGRRVPDCLALPACRPGAILARRGAFRSGRPRRSSVGARARGPASPLSFRRATRPASSVRRSLPLTARLTPDASRSSSSTIRARTGRPSPRDEPRARTGGCLSSRAESPPPGWSGKVWAMQQGVAAAEAAPEPPDYLLFVDADIILWGGLLRRLVAVAEAKRAVLASLMVKLRCESPAEHWLAPAFVFFFQMLYPFAWVNDPGRRTAAAAGGCMLVPRQSLAEAGGLAALRGALIDDCALAALMKRRGRVWLGLTQEGVEPSRVSDLRGLWPDGGAFRLRRTALFRAAPGHRRGRDGIRVPRASVARGFLARGAAGARGGRLGDHGASSSPRRCGSTAGRRSAASRSRRSPPPTCSSPFNPRRSTGQDGEACGKAAFRRRRRRRNAYDDGQPVAVGQDGARRELSGGVPADRQTAPPDHPRLLSLRPRGRRRRGQSQAVGRRKARAARPSGRGAVRLRLRSGGRAAAPRTARAGHCPEARARPARRLSTRRGEEPLCRLRRTDGLLPPVGDAGRAVRSRRPRRKPIAVAGVGCTLRRSAGDQPSSGLRRGLSQARPGLSAANHSRLRTARRSRCSADRARRAPVAEARSPSSPDTPRPWSSRAAISSPRIADVRLSLEIAAIHALARELADRLAASRSAERVRSLEQIRIRDRRRRLRSRERSARALRRARGACGGPGHERAGGDIAQFLLSGDAGPAEGPARGDVLGLSLLSRRRRRRRRAGVWLARRAPERARAASPRDRGDVRRRSPA